MRDRVEAALAAAATDRCGAVVWLDAEGARAAADQLDRRIGAGAGRGPLHGMTITVKDIIDVAGMPTRAGSNRFERWPKADAAAVARLRAAGAVILGKATTHEFALGVTTPACRNPFDHDRIAGGSSGGSAVAVATGIGNGSLGTDTRASLRVPASLCGVVGFKPTFGRVPTGGVVPLSWTV
ncbi:MAG TPA: amidase, partial [Actinomycetota bacterium]|nr:amidase [Actinomycetota bacterium]